MAVVAVARLVPRLVGLPCRAQTHWPRPRLGTLALPGLRHASNRRQPTRFDTQRGQASPIEAFIGHMHKAFVSVARAVRQAVAGKQGSDSSGLQGFMSNASNSVYALDDALRSALSRILAAARKPGGVSSAFRAAQSRSIAENMVAARQYYAQYPYESVYHLTAMLLLAYCAWYLTFRASKGAANPHATAVAWVHRNLTLSAEHIGQGKLWTPLTSPFLQVDYTTALGNAAMLLAYGTKCVSYVGPWYMLGLAAAGTATSSFTYLAAAALAGPSTSPMTPPAPAVEEARSSSRGVSGYIPSTEDGLSPGQRAYNLLTTGTHEGSVSSNAALPKSPLAPSLWAYPHLGPAGAVAAVAAFVVAAKPQAVWRIVDLQLPLAAPLVGYTAFTVGTALSASSGEATSSAAHLSGLGIGAGLYLGLRSGRLPYHRFWPK